jgi:hypothetical protein
MFEPTNPVSRFDRRLSDDRAQIESVCVLCGAVIIGSVLNGLPELETKHLAACKKPNVSIRILPSMKSSK